MAEIRRDIGLFDCVGGDNSTNCLIGLFCPCHLYARTSERLGELKNHEVSYVTALGTHLLGMLTGLTPFCQCYLTNEIYRDTDTKFGVGDFIASCICTPCKNCQDANNVDKAWTRVVATQPDRAGNLLLPM